MSPTHFLGLDPGYARLGYGVVSTTGGATSAKPALVEAGVFETLPHLPEGERLEQLQNSLKDLTTRYTIHSCIIENVFIKKNLTTATRLLEARGVILLTLYQQDIPYDSVTPTAMKKMVTGYGQAAKKDIQKMIMKLLHLNAPPQPDDAADALGFALCAWLKSRGRA